MSTIWFDVTSILRWKRPVVGIIRVEAECAKYALENLVPQVRFCRFDISGKYVSVSSEIVRKKLLDTNANIRALEKLPKKSNRLADNKNLVKSFVSRLVSVTRKIFSGKGSVKKLIYLATSAANEREIIFRAGDVYVSLGLDWDDKVLAYLYSLKVSTGIKTILCCYDVIPVKFPHLCLERVAAKFAHYLADLTWCANEILCISQCTRDDLRVFLEELGAPQPNMALVKLGSNLPVETESGVDDNTRNTVGRRFVIYVSTIERRKNHETLYRAYIRLIDSGMKNIPSLVFVGTPAWGVSDFLDDIKRDPRIGDYIKILTDVTDPDLTWLYRNALFTVFPSLYEGWGLPVAESLTAGKFCLASNATSIPEIGRDLIEYLDPWDVPLWAEKLKYYMENPEAVKQAEINIRRNYITYTWQETSRDVFSHAAALLEAT